MSTLRGGRRTGRGEEEEEEEEEEDDEGPDVQMATLSDNIRHRTKL